LLLFLRHFHRSRGTRAPLRRSARHRRARVDVGGARLRRRVLPAQQRTDGDEAGAAADSADVVRHGESGNGDLDGTVTHQRADTRSDVARADGRRSVPRRMGSAGKRSRDHAVHRNDAPPRGSGYRCSSVRHRAPGARGLQCEAALALGSLGSSGRVPRALRRRLRYGDGGRHHVRRIARNHPRLSGQTVRRERDHVSRRRVVLRRDDLR